MTSVSINWKEGDPVPPRLYFGGPKRVDFPDPVAEKFNPNHYPAGSERGGQFAPAMELDTRDAPLPYSDTPEPKFIRFGDLPPGGRSTVGQSPNFFSDAPGTVLDGVSAFPVTYDADQNRWQFNMNEMAESGFASLDELLAMQEEVDPYGRFISGGHSDDPVTGQHHWSPPIYETVRNTDIRPIYLLTGEVVGEGTDGEPLLQNPRILDRVRVQDVVHPGYFEPERDLDYRRHPSAFRPVRRAQKFNPAHRPAGDEHGGEFAPKDGAGAAGDVVDPNNPLNAYAAAHPPQTEIEKRIAALGLTPYAMSRVDLLRYQNDFPGSTAAQFSALTEAQIGGLEDAMHTLDANPDTAGFANWLRQTSSFAVLQGGPGDSTGAFTDMVNDNSHVLITAMTFPSEQAALDYTMDGQPFESQEVGPWSSWQMTMEGRSDPLGLSSPAVQREYWRNVYLHEMGHALDHATGMVGSDTLAMERAMNPPNIMRWVSGYGSTHPAEAFAEIFDMVASGHGDYIKGPVADSLRRYVIRAAQTLSTQDARSRIYNTFTQHRVEP